MERDLSDAGALQRLLEASDELGAIEWPPGFGVAEDQVTVAWVERRFSQGKKGGRDAVSHGDGAARACRFGIAELSAYVGTNDAQLPRGEVDVTPAQSEQLTLTQPGHRGREVKHRFDPTPGVVGKRSGEERFELRLVEEADARLRASDDGPVGELDGVRVAPAVAQPELEDGVHRAEVIAHRLGGKGALLDGDVALDVAGGNASELLAGEEGDNVVAEVRGDGQTVGLLPSADRQPRRERLAALEHGGPLDATGDYQLLGAEATERLLGFDRCQAIALTLRPGPADRPLDPEAVGAAPEAHPRSRRSAEASRCR